MNEHISVQNGMQLIKKPPENHNSKILLKCDLRWTSVARNEISETDEEERLIFPS